MMILSANEASSLIKLAMRGTGYSWGVAEESGLVLSWLTRHKLPALDILNCFLAWADDNDVEPISVDDSFNFCSAGLDSTCPLMAGIALNDFSYCLLNGTDIRLSRVCCPVLVLPFVASAAVSLDRCLRVRWPGGDIEIGHEGLIIQSSTQTWADSLSRTDKDESLEVLFCNSSHMECEQKKLSQSNGHRTHRVDSLVKQPLDTRVCVDHTCLQQLKHLAHRTYAPATEQSRIAGAGAGLNDND